MDPLDDRDVEAYLDRGLWMGKAGGFGYQDENDWIRIVDGSESNVVGLPMELLARLVVELPPDYLDNPVIKSCRKDSTGNGS